MQVRSSKLLKWLSQIPSPPHWVAWPFYFLIPYFLSTGPVARLCNSNSVPPGMMPFVEFVYAPVQWLSDNSSPFNTALRWYIDDVWGGGQ